MFRAIFQECFFWLKYISGPFGIDYGVYENLVLFRQAFKGSSVVSDRTNWETNVQWVWLSW